MRRNESNRAEKYHKAKHRQKINCAAWNNPESRCKSVQIMQSNGVARPARPVCGKPVSARTRWNLFGDHGVVQGGPGPARCRGRLRSGDARRLPWRGPGSEQQSESCHWATRFTGPLQVSTPRLPERTGRSMPEPGNAAR